MNKFAISALLIFLLETSFAIEPGFYDSSTEKAEQNSDLKNISKLLDAVDLILWNHGGEKFDFDRPKGDVRSLPLDELKVFLSKKSEKNLAVIHLSKVVMAKDDINIEAKGKELKEIFQEIGYKRILVLGANSFGIIVVLDSDEKEKTQP